MNLTLDVAGSNTLADRLKAVSKKRMSEKERLEQMVSYIYGSIDEESNITKEKIRDYLRTEQG